MEVDWRGDPDATVSVGGPVMTETGWLVHEPVVDIQAEPGTISIAPGIAISMSAAMLRSLAQSPPGHLRFFMGICRMGAGSAGVRDGQRRVATRRGDPELVFETPIDNIWGVRAALDRCRPG